MIVQVGKARRNNIGINVQEIGDRLTSVCATRRLTCRVSRPLSLRATIVHRTEALEARIMDLSTVQLSVVVKLYPDQVSPRLVSMVPLVVCNLIIEIRLEQIRLA